VAQFARKKAQYASPYYQGDKASLPLFVQLAEVGPDASLRTTPDNQTRLDDEHRLPSPA